DNPYTEIDLALSEAETRRAILGDDIPVIVRIVGNSGTDGLLSTQSDNTPYELGLDDNLVNRGDLVDGGTFNVPRGVTVMIDEGALLKLQDVNIDVGTSAVNVDRSGGAVQVLGTTFHNVVFTSWHDDTRGGNSDGQSFDEAPGDWGGIVYRGDSDYDFEFNETIQNPGIPAGPSNTKIRFDDFVFTDFPVDGNEATITITAVANLANSMEFLPVTIGVGGSNPISAQLFVDNGANPDGFAAGDVPVPLQARFTFTREELKGLVVNGTITVSIDLDPNDPNNMVDNLLFNESVTVNLNVASAEPIFLNRVNHATILYAGGPVEVDSNLQDFDAIHLFDSRPTITFNSISLSARAPISGNPNSFNDTFEDPTRYDHNRDRLGPDIHGNVIFDNSTNGLRIRTELQGGVPLEKLTVPARFSSTDIVYVITENLQIEGGAGGLVIDQNIDPDLTGDDGLASRPSGRLRIDPGVIVKLSQARIEAELGSSNFIAEGTPEDPIIFTSINDDTYGAGSTFDTNNDSTDTLIDLDFGAEGQEVWTAQGPGPIANGQTENVSPDNEVVGAIHVVVPHPSNPNVIWVAAVNGGVWKTENALDPLGPMWTPLTDFEESLSVSALVLDLSDPSFNTLVAGIGRTSSFGGPGGAFAGLLRSTDGGQTWTPLDGDGVLRGRNISGVVARGNTIVVSATQFSFLGGIGGGVYRSTNGGQSFELISGGPVSNLPTGTAFDLIADPTDASGNTLYVTIQNRGLFRSDNGGESWINVSVNQASQLAAFQNSGNNNAEIAVHPLTGRVYVGIIIDGQLAYIGYSDDKGASWVEMDLPITLESDGDFEGTSPRVKPGGQGFIHFSIVTDPTDPDIVYIGGDRQDSPFTNAIGANDFSGRLFRGDTSIAPVAPGSATNAFSPQWEHLTHTQDSGFVGGGTASNSSPHADSRDMAFLADGTLIEVDDGGIYRRTSPQDNTGDWFSLNGDIQVTEMHNVAYDSVSNILIGGAQDVGTSQQLVSGSSIWDQVFLETLPFRSGGDGGDVAVDDVTLAGQGQSIRYSSSQFLGNFRRQTYDANGVLVPGSEIFIDTTPINPFDFQFTTPIALNDANPLRMIIGGAFGVYEFNQGLGTPITQIASGIGVNSYNFNTRTKAEPIAYGHALNPDVLYVGYGNEVYLRSSAAGALLPTGFIGNYVNDIVMDSTSPSIAYVVDDRGVYLTSDSGGAWQEVTGNLSTIAPNGGFSSVEYIGGSTPLVIVGGRDGVFAMRADQPNFWVEVGTDLPNAIVFDLEYDQADNVLVASTMGRGVWTIENASV
ncbi:MAG: hypothetical protein KDA84_10745, partial [Planctomycetaceae bacterium]|nr:hypothetical protein [Planctomycetaceae bacterium]